MIQVNPDKQITTSDIAGGGESLDTVLSNINTNISNLTTTVNGKITGSGIANNLTTTTTGYALDATQGKSLKDSLDSLTTTVDGKITGTGIANNLTTTSSGYALDARQGKALNGLLTVTDITSQCSLNSSVVASCATFKVYKYNKLIYCYCGNIAFKNNGDSQTIVNGLPKALIQAVTLPTGVTGSASGYLVSSGAGFWIDTAGTTLRGHITQKDYNHWISLWYFAQ